MKLLSTFLISAFLAAAQNVAGDWKLSVDTPHGTMSGALHLKQEGTKLAGTCEVQPMGTFPLTGSLDKPRIALHLELPNGDIFKMSGTLDGDKMSGTTDPGAGNWSAERGSSHAGAQPAAAKPVSGTVVDFKPAALEIAVRSDSGENVFVKVGPETEVMRVPPGEHDLSQAKPARLTSLGRGDRVLVSYVTGLAEARRIVWISANDIDARNQAERDDWKTRGISGIVTAVQGQDIAIEIRTPQGAHTATIAVTGKTKVRRYAPDSVKFAGAVPASVAEIAVGDQVQARGKKSGDGSRVAADDVVFGTFLTKLGEVTAIHPESHEIEIQDLVAKTPLLVRISADTRLKTIPGMHAMPAGSQEPANFDMQAMLESLPAGNFDNLKVGGGVIVTATRGARPGQVTAILLLANADMFLRMAQEHGGDGLSKLHGGMLMGPTGISLPAMLH